MFPSDFEGSAKYILMVYYLICYHFTTAHCSLTFVSYSKRKFKRIIQDDYTFLFSFFTSIKYL